MDALLPLCTVTEPSTGAKLRASASGSGIEWTDATVNDIVGCAVYESGCTHCYAQRMAHRMGANSRHPLYGAGLTSERGKWTGSLLLFPGRLEATARQRKGKVIFRNSMSDTFFDGLDDDGRGVPDSYIRWSYEQIAAQPQHTWLNLTKRAARLRAMGPSLHWGDNVWQGVSVCSAEGLSRVDDLRACGAKHKFLSCEPLIGPLDDLDVRGIDWVIAGGESGPRTVRPMHVAWLRTIRDKCAAAGVPFFFKQFGAHGPTGRYEGVKSKANPLLDGRLHHEMPDALLDVYRRDSRPLPKAWTHVGGVPA